MGWTPPPRPDWVRAVNAGENPLLREEAEQPLTRDALVGEALARVGRSAAHADEIDAALGHPDFPWAPALERLDRFLEALADEAELHALGRILARRFLVRVIAGRAQLIDWLERDPGVEEERIDSPWIVAGAPRTGTTILFALLAADPAHRVPRGWELLHPVPPPSPDPAARDRDPRIALADRELIAPQTVVGGLRAIHEYGGRKPKECLSAHSFALGSEELTTRFNVPSFAAWLEDQDTADAYHMHRLVLQILQRGHPPTAWVLKSPVHLHDLPTVFATYPDARVAITHRDPVRFLASLTSLVANLRWAHSDAVDPRAIAREHVERWAGSLDRLVDWTEAEALPADRIHHSHFRDFRTAPLETVAALYDRFERPLSSDAQQAMDAALAADAPDRAGAHAYSTDDLPAPADALRPRFARYQAAFDVPDDG